MTFQRLFGSHFIKTPNSVYFDESPVTLANAGGYRTLCARFWLSRL